MTEFQGIEVCKFLVFSRKLQDEQTVKIHPAAANQDLAAIT
jgi:hypothetical protein